MRYKHDKYRKALLAEDPHCHSCGAEHGTGSEALHYHHLIPQHTGNTDHSYGILLCRQCHSYENRKQRNEHKQVNIDGTITNPHNPFAKKKSKLQQQREIYSLVRFWSR